MATEARIFAAMEEARTGVPAVLRALKWQLGYRDEDIALACGMTRSAVNNRMAGKTHCQPHELAGFAELFGVPVEIFYKTPGEAISLCEQLGVEPRRRGRHVDSDTGGPSGKDKSWNRWSPDTAGSAPAA